jgi:2,4-dienoyl-CoA reductase-like NADH-dependent reductase (Old Yellow Enzyme family)
VLLTLDASTPPAPLTSADLLATADAFTLGAWRALCAGADGIMLTAADGGLLHTLFSPLHNQRADAFGPGLDGRLRLALLVCEQVRRWLGPRLLIGFRMLADELAPGGTTLQDARVAAKRLVAGGVRLLDLVAPANTAQVARFPGWAIPLANSIKRVADVPVIGSGLLGDPLLADSVVRDGSVDLVMLDGTLRADPDWPQAARALLAGQG